MSFKPVGDQFHDTRVILHHAAQVASALGATHLEADEDHQYANLGWSDEHNALLGRPVNGLQAGLRLHDGSWLLVRGNTILAKLSVQQSTVSGALAWLEEAVREAGGPKGPLEPVGYELPEKPLTSRPAFGALDARTCRTLSEWYKASAAVLERIAESDGGSEVRCWPHHFDIATLIRLDPEQSSEEARSIGVGMTPGDGTIGEPYLYVTPWPYPQEWPSPELPVGHWNREGWFGAVLSASEVESDSRVEAFLEAARVACRQILDGG